jgi:predicted transport protein
MSDIRLFRLQPDAVQELPGTSVAVEKSLQTLIERHLEVLLGVRFLASEHSTGKTHRGRIDTLGIDENNRPVIIEYKRALNQNVINQGLYYLNWLMDHKADLKFLVLDRLGREVANVIEWGSPRLLCIAGDFTKFDEEAIQQIPRNIELIRYRRYGDDLLLFELVNATAVEPIDEVSEGDGVAKPKPVYKTVMEQLAQAPAAVRDRYAALDEFLKALGDDVQLNTLKYYLAYKRIKNFACVEIRSQNQRLLVYAKIDPDSISLEEGFTRDVRNVGHFGTGDLEITIDSAGDLERAKPLLIGSYEAS